MHLTGDELRDAAGDAPSIVAEIVDTIDGDGLKFITAKMAARFAQEIVSGTNPISGAEERFSVKTKAAAAKAINSGMLETVRLSLMDRIVREKATLWTEGETYTYDGVGESFAADIQAARAAGADALTMARVDSLGVAVGSSACLVQILGSKLNYQPIRRDCIWVAHAADIMDGDEMRGVNNLAIDEASAVVVKLGTSADGKGEFAAWFGRSDVYNNGRFVQYVSDKWSNVPPPGEDADALDYWIDDAMTEVGNPLTLWADDNDGTGPEYPIVTWLGDSAGYGGALLPVQTDLFEQGKEIDLAASRLLLSALKGARGATVLTKDPGGSNIIPDVLDEGVVVLEQGQALSQLGHAVSNSKDGLDIVQKMMQSIAASHGVPGYMMAISDSVQMPSGVALAIANEPLSRNRRGRIELNRENVARKFALETALAGIENGTGFGDVTETWKPNAREFPVDPEAQARAWKQQLDIGLVDVVELAQEFKSLDSREAAENYIATLTKPEPPPTAPQPRGLQALRPRGVANPAQ